MIHRSSPSKPETATLSTSGFTLSELVIMMFVSTVVMSAMGSLGIWGAREFNRLQSEISAQQDVMSLEVTLRTYMGQAVNVYSSDLMASGITIAGNAGLFNGNPNGTPKAYSNLASHAGDGDPVPIGLFFREWGFSNEATTAANYVSDIVPTGIFFKRPEAAASGNPSRAGVIFIDTGAGGLPISPGYDDLFFPGITEVTLEKKASDRNHEAGNNRLVGYSIRFTMRFHLADNRELTFCPTADVGVTSGCVADGGAYFDIEREVRVTFTNNDLHRPLTGVVTNPNTLAAMNWVYERPLGFLHFFRPVFPDAWAN